MSDDGRLWALGALGVLAAGVGLRRGSLADRGEIVVTRTGVRHVVDELTEQWAALRPVEEAVGPTLLIVPLSMIVGYRIEPGEVFAHQIVVCERGCGAEFDPDEPLITSALIRAAGQAGWSTGPQFVCPDCLDEER